MKDIIRPPKDQIEALKKIGAATVAGTLAHMGIRNTHIQGPVSWHKGRVMVGPALTLLFMPKTRISMAMANMPTPKNSCIATSCMPRRRGMLWSSMRGVT